MGMFVYLFVFFAVSINLYFTEKIKVNSFAHQFILWFPAFFIYIIPLALQFNVGTDYFSYYNNFYDGGHTLFLKKQEYLYYYLEELVIALGEPQLQFVFVSIIQGTLFFYTLYLLKNKGYNVFLIFLIFFLATGMYHNQMNGIRQYIAIYCFIIFCLFAVDKKYLKAFLFFLLGFYFHKSILIPLLYFIPFLFTRSSVSKYAFLGVLGFFVFSLLIHLFNWSSFVQVVLNTLSLNYSHYLDSDYGQGKSITEFVTKFYYIPLYILFFIVYFGKKDREYSVLLLALWALTCFIYIQGIYFSLFVRTWAYFTFFMIFPIYYLFYHYRKNHILVFILFSYLFVVYLLKISIFALGEYDYNIYRGFF